jgi:quercetin dioxygenase-like cupin family protein
MAEGKREEMMETSTFLGTENRVLLTASETEGAVGVIDISVQPGAGVPLHTNTREALIWYVIAGQLTLQTEQGPVAVAAGSTSFLPPGSTHRFSNPSGSPARALLVCIPGGFEGFLLDLSGRLPAGMPAGPPPREAAEVMVGIAEQYGVRLHLENAAF